jgi:hypothetical protein
VENQEKAKLIADQCKPCSADFYSGIKQGVIIALKASDEEKKELIEALNKINQFSYIGSYGLAITEMKSIANEVLKKQESGIAENEVNNNEKILNLLKKVDLTLRCMDIPEHAPIREDLKEAINLI